VQAQEIAECILRAKSLFDAKFTDALTEAALDVFHYPIVLESWAGLQS